MVKNSLRKEYIGATYCHPSYSISMQSTSHKILGWMKSQAGIKIPGRNINNLRYTDDITQMSKSKEKLKSLLTRVKEESEKAGLISTFMASGPITSWQIDGEKMEIVTDFIFLGSKITVDSDCSQRN